jgi:AcrR family transcriptional regulator
MPRQSNARQKMIESAAVLFREQGVQGTSFSDVLAHSGAPRGSIYHHFPRGKTQLTEETTEWAGEYILATTIAALHQRDPVGAIETISRWWSSILQDSDYAAGCVIVAATLDGENAPSVRATAAQAFSKWEDALTTALRKRGVPAARARSLATLTIAAIEGAVILSRAKQSTTPLNRVTQELRITLTDALDLSTLPTEARLTLS